MKKPKYVYRTFYKSYFDESTNQIRSKEIKEKRTETRRERKLFKIFVLLLFLGILCVAVGLPLMIFGGVIKNALLSIIGTATVLSFVPFFYLSGYFEDKRDAEVNKNWEPIYNAWIKHNKQEQKRCEEWRRAHPIEETVRKIMEDNNSVELAYIIKKFLENKGE